MKKIFLISIAIVVIAVVSIIGCNKDDITTITAVSNTTGRGIADQVNAFAKEPLSNDEMTSIQWMREEEKLAHDVYVTLYNKWRMNIFTNIAESEQTHENAVVALMAKYGIPDNTPAAIGVFTNPDVQEL